MSDQSIWKMLHLLRLYGRVDAQGEQTLGTAELDAAGVNCFDDTIREAIRGGAVEGVPPGPYKLKSAAAFVLDRCVVGRKKWQNADELRVDHPSVFVAMPFGECWSNDVWGQLIQPAAAQAGLACIRGDTVLHPGDLMVSVWNAILGAGAIVADLSSTNVNVFYELGLAHAIGKDVFVLKQRDVDLAADFQGNLFQTYDRGDPGKSRPELAQALENWSKNSRVAGIAALAGGRR